MLTTTGGSPRPVTTLAGAWANMGPPLLPRPFTNMTANHVTSFPCQGLSRVLVETGDLRGERHRKTYPALPQGRNWQVPQSSEDKRPVAGREDGHCLCGAPEEKQEWGEGTQAEGAQEQQVGGGGVLLVGHKATRGPHPVTPPTTPSWGGGHRNSSG